MWAIMHHLRLSSSHTLLNVDLSVLPKGAPKGMSEKSNIIFCVSGNANINKRTNVPLSLSRDSPEA